jgi:hypothetical protein
LAQRANGEIPALGRTTKTLEKSTLTSINENDALAQAYVERGEREAERQRIGREQLPEPVHPEPVIGEKVTSPEIASIAARYMASGFTGPAFDDVPARVLDDIKRVFASVLSQAEGGVK